MKTLWVFVVLLACYATPHAVAEQAPIATARWEYKTIRVPAQGGSYTRVGSQYSSVGSEATSVLPAPEALNSLGAQGWELVGVYMEVETAFPNFAQGDTVQGLKSNVRPQDVVLIFKRNYDAERTRKDAELEASEASRRAAEFKKAQEESAKDNAGVLIDLDALDFLKATAVRRSAEEKKLSDAIAEVKGYKIVNKAVDSAAASPNDSGATAVIVLDGTDKLLKDGNKYRKSEAVSLAREFADAVYEKADLKTSKYGSRELDAITGDVKIQVQVVITFGGQQKLVGESAVGGMWKSD